MLFRSVCACIRGGQTERGRERQADRQERNGEGHTEIGRQRQIYIVCIYVHTCVLCVYSSTSTHVSYVFIMLVSKEELPLYSVKHWSWGVGSLLGPAELLLHWGIKRGQCHTYILIRIGTEINPSFIVLMENSGDSADRTWLSAEFTLQLSDSHKPPCRAHLMAAGREKSK